MLTIKLKNHAAVEVKSIKASKYANSTQVHNTALLSIGYDCDVKLEKKHFIFVVDTSSSMKNKDVISDEDENISRIVAAKKAIFDIAYESDKKHLHNTYSMITFNKEAQVLLDGGDIYDLAKKKEDIKLDIGTSIYHGMLKIKELDSFGKTPKDNTIVILLSDGHSTLINEEKGICCLPGDVKRMLKEEYPLVEYRFFDPKEVIDNLTYNGQCPRIFSMGIGLGYDEKYIGELSNATNAALTHVKKQSDFTKPLHSGFFDIKPIPATFEIQDGDEALNTKEVVLYSGKDKKKVILTLDKKILNTTEVTLYSGKDKEVVFSLDKKILNTLFANGVVQVRVGNDIPSSISVDVNQVNKIDKRIALDFYRAKKADTLCLTNNVPLSLMWDIPQTGEFCDDKGCKKERKKLFKEVKIKDREKMLQLRSSSSYIRPMGYITVIDPEVAQAMEKEKTYVSPINLEVMMQPNSVLAFNEKDGYASVQTYNRDELFRLAKLNPEKDTRKTLTEKFREAKIIDPITRLHMIEPVRNYVKEEEIKRDIEEKGRKDLLKEQEPSEEVQQEVGTYLSKATCQSVKSDLRKTY